MLYDALINRLIWARMQMFTWTHWRPFVKTARAPWDAQERLLLQFLRQNCETKFGQLHGFDRIRSYRDFVSAVSIQSYESLRPFIEEQERTGTPALSAVAPVMYAQTSGTTGQPKLIPLLESTLRSHKRSQAIQSYVQFKTDPRAYYGKLLGIVGLAEEGRLQSGRPYGSASGHVYKNMPRLTRAKYVIPHQVFGIEDYDLKYLTILRLALVHRNVTFLGSANPSTFLKLLSVLEIYREELLEDIRREEFRYLARMTHDARAAIQPRLRCKPARLRELEQLLHSPSPRFADLWPNLRLVNTWTGGSCAIPLAAFERHLPPTTRIAELGYLSSEFRGTITVDVERNWGAPTIQENFLEFVEREAWDGGDQKTLTVDALETGKQYYVIVTTAAGLYRYFMNDIITVTGRFHATPTIQFVQKGKGVTNITGEKLTESQIIEAVRSSEEELGVRSTFFLMLACVQESNYRLLLEPAEPSDGSPSRMRDLVESKLTELNVEYAAKRASGRLRELELVHLRPGTGEAYKRHCLRLGQREGQFKIITLQYLDDGSFSFGDYYLRGSA
ncbi:MAG TPA: GH3 auxin-responsive promoter family protein [Vicinamibacteria bacterium]|nr:GH3 auxin-responsive promoter family protein [Vicinamibacteria bacterium]